MNIKSKDVSHPGAPIEKPFWVARYGKTEARLIIQIEADHSDEITLSLYARQPTPESPSWAAHVLGKTDLTAAHSHLSSSGIDIGPGLDIGIALSRSILFAQDLKLQEHKEKLWITFKKPERPGSLNIQNGRLHQDRSSL
jgi:hypothetical protein